MTLKFRITKDEYTETFTKFVSLLPKNVDVKLSTKSVRIYGYDCLVVRIVEPNRSSPYLYFLTHLGNTAVLGNPPQKYIESIKNWVAHIQWLKFSAFLKKHNSKLKEELIATVWHPSRVEKWIKAGINLEDL